MIKASRLRVAALATIFLVISVAAGCARFSTVEPAASSSSSAQAEQTGRSGEYPWVYHGSVSDKETWSGDAMVVEPVADTTSLPAIVSPQQALNACVTGDAVCPKAGQQADVYLGYATSPTTGDADKDGNIKPKLEKALVYEAVWHGEPCAPAGPVSESSDTLSSCTLVAWIDAQSGKFAFGYQFAS